MKRCYNCISRGVCWLRRDYNKLAVEAQNMGIVGAAWQEWEVIAEKCQHYVEEEE